MAAPPPPPPPGIGLRKIFITPDGTPLEFYISPEEPLHDKYVRIIEDHGGIVHEQETANLLSSVIFLGSEPQDLRSTVSFRFVDESVARGYVAASDTQERSHEDSLALVADSINSSGNTNANRQPKKRQKPLNPRGPSKKFTAAADQYILEQVRMKPRFRTSHKFFEELAKHEQLEGHTGNSIRSRFRLQLENKMEYVYKTNDHDEIELDENGQRLAISVEGAKTLKTKYTADDDYNLCCDVLSHVVTNQTLNVIRADSGPFELDEGKFSVPISFFDQYAIRHPHHSSLSWRDRYRKFARVYGVQKYKEDYENSVGTKLGPQPMQLLTKRRDNSKDEKSKAKKLKAPPPQVYSHQLSALDSHNHNHDPAFHAHNSVHDMDSISGHMDASAAAAVANMAVASRDNAALDKSLINSNIHEALRDVGAEAGRVNIEDDMISAIHPTLAGAVHGQHGVDEAEVHAFGDMGITHKAEEDSQDPLSEFPYMPRDTIPDGILRPDFYHQSLKTTSKKLYKMLAESGPQDVDKVTNSLESLGFTRAFVKHMIRVTSAHANYLNEYVKHVLRHIEADSGLAEDVLYFHNRDGFWTPETDEALMKENYGVLEHMSQENINIRRDFLGLH